MGKVRINLMVDDGHMISSEVETKGATSKSMLLSSGPYEAWFPIKGLKKEGRNEYSIREWLECKLTIEQRCVVQYEGEIY
jgi:hypothetical protein